MKKPNIYLIIIDALRKDFSKNLENKLKNYDFLNYNNAISPSSWTVSSHVSMITGLYPIFHGVHETRSMKGLDIKFKKSNLLITHFLNKQGYQNILLTANPHLTPQHGYKDFSIFYEVPPYESKSFLKQKDIEEFQKIINLRSIDKKSNVIKKLIAHKKYKLLIKIVFLKTVAKLYNIFFTALRRWPKNKGGKKLIKHLLKLTNKNSNKKLPIFAFINLMEVHNPYTNGATGNLPFHLNYKSKKEKIKIFLNSKFRSKIKKLYEKEINLTINNIIYLLNKLKKLNTLDNSLIIITSDHGQLLGEHEKISHGTYLYNELLRVPLLIKYPKNTNIKKMRYEDKYISLIKLKTFIEKFIENDLLDDNILYSDVVFSETYGFHQEVYKYISNQKFLKVANEDDCYKISIYYKNYKGIFNVKNWKFEELINLKSNEKVPKNIIDHMRKKTMNFLKIGIIANNEIRNINQMIKDNNI